MTLGTAFFYRKFLIQGYLLKIHLENANDGLTAILEDMDDAVMLIQEAPKVNEKKDTDPDQDQEIDGRIKVGYVGFDHFNLNYCNQKLDEFFGTKFH